MDTSHSIPVSAVGEEYAEVVEAAESATREAYDPDRFDGAHLVGAAVRGGDGDIHTGVSVPTQLGRAGVCAEPVAIGSAIDAGTTEFEAIVAVGHPRPDEEDYEYTVIPPCGVCREMIADYGADIDVLVPHEDAVRVVDAIELLPTRTW